MLGADEFVLQFRHLFFRAVEYAAEVIPNPLIDIPTGYAGQLLERAAQLLFAATPSRTPIFSSRGRVMPSA